MSFDTPPEERTLTTQLLAYALGTLPQEEVLLIEATLLESKEALTMYLALKRSLMPTNTALQARPSERAKARLRQAVAQRYATPVWPRWLRWLQRPVPLYKGFAAASIFTIVLALIWAWWPQSTPNTASPMIDTATQSAEQLRWS